MNPRDEFKNVSVTVADASLSRAAYATSHLFAANGLHKGLAGRGRHAIRCQPACYQLQACQLQAQMLNVGSLSCCYSRRATRQ